MKFSAFFRAGLLTLFITAIFFTFPGFSSAQNESASISGVVTDSSGALVIGADILLQSLDQGTVARVTTNSSGIYTFSSVRPGQYRISARKDGFKQVDVLGLTVNVQDRIEENFRLQPGSVTESITISTDAPILNTEDAAVSTVVDRNFTDNLPMNGRSFQTLVELTPGVVVTPSTLYDPGQFSVDGQRGSSNYWMVDGVGANVGTGVYGIQANGTQGATSVLGGTNSLVSVDALQEFRIQTSTYAPEFGRTPGAQISIVTRSGTNVFHGSLFDYLRNDVFDANNWFNGVNILNATPLPKAKERQNDFGGTLGGPIKKDRVFFFFSYEGLRLGLPTTALSTVPDLAARQNAVAAVKPILNAFPLDPAQPDLGNGIAQFNASFTNPASLDAISLRLDYNVNDKWNVFARYNYSPSQLTQRGTGLNPLSNVGINRIVTNTGTVGATWMISPRTTNDLRFNYSAVSASSHFVLDTFGGAVPFAAATFLPAMVAAQDAKFSTYIPSLTDSLFTIGNNTYNKQRQINIIDALSLQKGSHSLKFGIDIRRLSPQYIPSTYSQFVNFGTVPSAEEGMLDPEFPGAIENNLSVIFRFLNLGVFAEDTWRVFPKVTLTYGVRWDIDFAPTTLQGPNFPTAVGFNLNDLSQLALGPNRTTPYNTYYGGVAPRLGLAYEIRPTPGSETVVRAGVGVFYDLAGTEIGNLAFQSYYPFGATSDFTQTAFPLDEATAAPPAIVPPSATNSQALTAIEPNLKLPYSLEWNVAVQQALGKQQSISATYLGSVGRRLIQSTDVYSPNANLSQAILVSNAATSDYNGLQLQFQRRLYQHFQGLASYTLAHSIDDASASSIGNPANTGIAGLSPSINRGPSDFDIRNAVSAGATYEIPDNKLSGVRDSLLKGWSLDTFITARSAPPVNVFNSLWGFETLFNNETQVRPDVVAGIPFYLHGPQYPGGIALNAAAFTAPPMNAVGEPLRQGDLGRNALRGFGATQWDLAVHRDFPIHETLRLQFRAEAFNVLNHPNFGPPQPDLGSPNFGVANATLANSLAGTNLGAGAFSPLYQLGGPRSLQFALKLTF